MDKLSLSDRYQYYWKTQRIWVIEKYNLSAQNPFPKQKMREFL